MKPRCYAGIAASAVAPVIAAFLVLWSATPRVHAASLQWEQGAEALTDSQMERAVRQALRRDRAVRSSAIDLEVRDGIVHLSGTTPTLYARDRAIGLANAVRDVRGVEGAIELEQGRRSDPLLEEQLSQDLADNPVTAHLKIQPDVHEGVVTLTGQVRSWQQWREAEDTARRVRGVRGVENDITVRRVSTRPDTEIAADVRASLRNDARLADNQLEVKVRRGHVTIRGHVGSELEKGMAIADATVLNVRSVNADELEVVPSRAARLFPYEDLASDQEIRQAILRLIRQHPWLSPSELSVSVQNRVATLSGEVDDIGSKWAAEQEARRVAGVREVRNRLRVESEFQDSARSRADRRQARLLASESDEAPIAEDQELAAIVQRALARDPYVFGHDIVADAHGGTVTLEGNVDSTFERLEAEQVATMIPGVEAVQNNLRVLPDQEGYRTWPFYDLNPKPGTAEYRPGSSVSDTELEDRIQGRLTSSPQLLDNSVRVRVISGQARLEGIVDSLHERTIASRIARASGAHQVINLLDVRP
jgi:osmotically-inducible protein OsmY